MIIIGYQGIGKSTLTHTCPGESIDLESSNFFFEDENGERRRWDNWYNIYCNIAEDLSRQGYIVFTSSHKEVRDRLYNSTERVIAIVPSPGLKDQWINKLKIRYGTTLLEKDYKALKNAEDRYEDNIAEILNDCRQCIKITDIDYDLYSLIKQFMIEETIDSAC